MNLKCSAGCSHYDFSWLEEALSVDCFTHLTHYHAIQKKELMYNKNVSEKVRSLSEKLAACADGEEFFTHVTDFYRDYGVGMFGLNKAFRIAENEDGTVRFLPINNMDTVMLGDLIGYESQKQKAGGEYESLLRREAGQQRPFIRRQRNGKIHQRKGDRQPVLSHGPSDDRDL